MSVVSHDLRKLIVEFVMLSCPGSSLLVSECSWSCECFWVLWWSCLLFIVCARRFQPEKSFVCVTCCFCMLPLQLLCTRYNTQLYCYMWVKTFVSETQVYYYTMGYRGITFIYACLLVCTHTVPSLWFSRTTLWNMLSNFHMCLDGDHVIVFHVLRLIN